MSHSDDLNIPFLCELDESIRLRLEKPGSEETLERDAEIARIGAKLQRFNDDIEDMFVNKEVHAQLDYPRNPTEEDEQILEQIIHLIDGKKNLQAMVMARLIPDWQELSEEVIQARTMIAMADFFEERKKDKLLIVSFREVVCELNKIIGKKENQENTSVVLAEQTRIERLRTSHMEVISDLISILSHKDVQHDEDVLGLTEGLDEKSKRVIEQDKLIDSLEEERNQNVAALEEIKSEIIAQKEQISLLEASNKDKITSLERIADQIKEETDTHDEDIVVRAQNDHEHIDRVENILERFGDELNTHFQFVAGSEISPDNNSAVDELMEEHNSRVVALQTMQKEHLAELEETVERLSSVKRDYTDAFAELKTNHGKHVIGLEAILKEHIAELEGHIDERIMKGASTSFGFIASLNWGNANRVERLRNYHSKYVCDLQVLSANDTIASLEYHRRRIGPIVEDAIQAAKSGP